MDLAIGTLAMVGLGTSGVALALARGRGRIRKWMETAQKAGLTEVQKSGGLSPSVTGRLGRLRVRLESYRKRKLVAGTRIVIAGMGHGYQGLGLRRGRFATALEMLMGGKGIETGDKDFDQVVRVSGSIPLARALLDSPTRGRVRDLLDGRLRVADGRPALTRGRLSGDELRIDVPDRRSLFSGDLFGRARPAGRHLPEVLLAALALAQRLVVPPVIPARIIENLSSEPNQDVRLQCLLTLIQWCPKNPETRKVLLAATKQGSDEARLRAAIALGEEGHEALIALASREDVEEPYRLRAIAELGPRLSRETAEKILEGELAAPRTLSAMACVRALGRIGGEAVLPALIRALAVSHGELGAAAARALGATGLPAAEAPLLRALAVGDETVRLAAVEALGRAGTVASIPLLLEAAKQHPGEGLKSASRQAIAEIQARLEGAETGQLSLAAGEAGHLSLSEERASGKLSIAEDKATGKLTLAQEEAPCPPRREKRSEATG
jgi:HEAT repeat protein